MTASGSNTRLAVVVETVPGTSPGGNWALVNGARFSLGATQQFLENDLFGAGRDAQQRARDIKDTAGQASVPIDLVDVGLWLSAALGVPTTTGGPNYVHTFPSGATILNTLSIEQQHPDVSPPVYFSNNGVKVNSYTFRMEPRGLALFDLNLQALDAAVPSNTSLAGTPARLATFSRLSQFHNMVEIDLGGGWIQLAKNVSFSFTYDNRVETIYYTGGAGVPGDINLSPVQLSGDMTIRLQTKQLWDLANAGTVFALRAGWVLGDPINLTTATSGLIMTFPAIEVGSGPPGVQGAAGVETTFQWSAHASQDTASPPNDLTAMSVELRNQYAGAAYG